MLNIVFVILIFAFSWSELIVDRTKEGLTSVPRDINVAATTLKLDRNSITHLHNNSFDYLLSLEELFIRKNGITYIARYALGKNSRLHLLYIGGHKLLVFPTHLGGASQRLMTIDLRGTVDVNSMQLMDFPRLHQVALNYNKIVTGNLTMKHLPSLKSLFAPRCNLHIFPDLSAAPALQFVQLHYNKFPVIPAFPWRNLLRLRTFACMDCHIRYLPDMSHLVSLKSLIVPGNSLVVIPDLFHLPLTSIYLAGNPMECSMSICWLRMWNDINPTFLELDPSGTQMTCASPAEVIGFHLADIHPVAMKCYTGDSPTDTVLSINNTAGHSS